jgi:ribonuclease D
MSNPQGGGPSPDLLPPDTLWVDSQEALNSLMERVAAAQAKDPNFRSCIDTEADSLHHYFERLCLVQLAFADEFVLIDPLAVEDILPLLQLLDKGEIWLHGADYDLSLFQRTFKWMPQRMRDTQIAARLTGSRQFGLAALIEAHTGRTVSKSSQKADWSRRPLSSTMLHYAVDDVRYLFSLADGFLKTLATQGRMDWFIQSCDELCKDVSLRSLQAKEDPWRIQGSGKLQPKGLDFVHRVWHWRDLLAQERNVPCFRIISNKQVMEMAQGLEREQMPNPPFGWRPKWKRDFTDLLAAHQQSDPTGWPQKIRQTGGRMSEREREQVDRLCQERDTIASRLNIEGSLLGSRSVMEQIVAKAEGIDELMAWQQELMAAPLLTARTILGFLPTA